MQYKLLVIDDESMITELLSDHLCNNGYTVYVIKSKDKLIKAGVPNNEIVLLSASAF